MFKQITNLNGHEWYLITSLWMFLAFFIIVGVLLFFMKKDHITYMGHMPLNDPDNETQHSTNQNNNT